MARDKIKWPDDRLWEDTKKYMIAQKGNSDPSDAEIEKFLEDTISGVNDREIGT